MNSVRIVGLATMIGLGLYPTGLTAGSFNCHFKDQPVMIISLDYPEAHVDIDGVDYPLQNTALPVMTATVNGAIYEFGIKSYGATNASLPAKLEIRSGGWGGNGEASYSEKTVCHRLK
ncbi:hypothetical protein LBMAG20_08030 [Methylocystaceae bacterium]|nr:hypothetical protein LBMAG20_08030 [Methylocystaceae bacterium]